MLFFSDSPLSRACGVDTSHSSPSGSPRPKAPTPGAVAGLDLIPVSKYINNSLQTMTATFNL